MHSCLALVVRAFPPVDKIRSEANPRIFDEMR